MEDTAGSFRGFSNIHKLYLVWFSLVYSKIKLRLDLHEDHKGDTQVKVIKSKDAYCIGSLDDVNP